MYIIVSSRMYEEIAANMAKRGVSSRLFYEYNYFIVNITRSFYFIVNINISTS